VYIANEEASLPTVSIKAVMILCIINAKEDCDVAVAAFMQANIDELVQM
jgi:hypothetical protein